MGFNVDSVDHIPVGGVRVGIARDFLGNETSSSATTTTTTTTNIEASSNVPWWCVLLLVLLAGFMFVVVVASYSYFGKRAPKNKKRVMEMAARRETLATDSDSPSAHSSPVATAPS